MAARHGPDGHGTIGRRIAQVAEGDRRDRRLARIRDLVAAAGYVSIGDLVDRLGVTEQTVRRDLAALAAAGRLRRTHGGAAALGADGERPVGHDPAECPVVKRRIAAAVAEFVPDGAAVFLDSGPTCEAVADALVARRQLSVVTYSLRIAARLAERTDFVVAITGGVVRGTAASVFRDGAGDFLRCFRFDVAVMCADAVGLDGSIAGDDHHAATLVRTAIERASSVVLAVDSSAFGRSALVYLGHVREVATVVTDAQPPAAMASALAASGTRLQVAEG